MVLAADTNKGASLFILVALVVVAFLVRRGRLASKSANLERGERMRPLAISCIDPLVSLLIIGPLLWRLVSSSGGNALAAIAGGVVGAVIGYYRAKVMFVRADKTSFSVVLKRSGVEYGLVLVLIVLRSIEGQLTLDHTSAATVAVSAISGLGLVEAFVRAGCIIGRYVTHAPTPQLGGPETIGDGSGGPGPDAPRNDPDPAGPETIGDGSGGPGPDAPRNDPDPASG